MNAAGLSVRLTALSVKSPAAAVLAALLLSACVDGGQLTAPEAPPVEQLVEQPPIITDASIYAARSDGQYTVPGLPVDQIPESHRRQIVDYATEQPAGTIIIDPSTKLLYYVLGENKALRYGISVGAEGFQWSGEAVVSRKGQWPKWYPPKEMIERKPSLEKWKDGQPGGPTNPLGSRAIYLTSNGVDYGYRIHGTPEWKTIGRNASSGCFRMIQQDVMDLFERVKGGEKVIVLTGKGEMPSGLNIPKPPAPKKKAEPKPQAAVLPLAPGDGPVLMGPPPALGGSAIDAGATSPSAVSPSAVSPIVTSPVATSPVDSGSVTAPITAPTAPSTADQPAADTPPSVGLPTAPAPVAPVAPVAPAPAAPSVLPVVPMTPTAPLCAVPLVNGQCPA